MKRRRIELERKIERICGDECGELIFNVVQQVARFLIPDITGDKLLSLNRLLLDRLVVHDGYTRRK